MMENHVLRLEIRLQVFSIDQLRILRHQRYRLSCTDLELRKCIEDRFSAGVNMTQNESYLFVCYHKFAAVSSSTSFRG